MYVRKLYGIMKRAVYINKIPFMINSRKLAISDVKFAGEGVIFLLLHVPYGYGGGGGGGGLRSLSKLLIFHFQAFRSKDK